MGTIANPNYDYNPAILQDLVNKFRELQLLMELIAKDLKEISCWKERHNFEFLYDEKTGLISKVSVTTEIDLDYVPYHEMIEDYKRFCVQQSEGIQDYLAQFHFHHLETLKALDTLARPLQRRLADLRKGRHWVTLAIRFCMLPSSRWPRLPSREVWRPNISIVPKRPNVPDRFDWVFDYYQETDPTASWQRICRRFDSLVDDLVAVAWAFGSEISREPDGPCGDRQWRHEGKVIDEQMAEKPWMLAKYLFEHKPRKVPFTDMAESVFGEREELIEYNSVSNPRTEANRFFRKHHIPWEVNTHEKYTAFLRHLSQEEL